MAEKRIRENEVVEDNSTQLTPTIITPIEAQPAQNINYESILELIEKSNKEIAELKQQRQLDQAVISKLTEEVAEAKGDISEKVKESKRRYGYNLDGTRKPDELFKFKYNVLFDENKEKVVIKTETIGRPTNVRNNNTGKWTNIHNVKITFHDKTTTEMDVLDYLNQRYQIEEFVEDKNISLKDGKKFYTFKTEKFGTFTLEEKFIN